ncbi:TPR repeat region-containing protein [Glycomyces terrestris]|uniref:TPR repeat domain-containing protein n=1 Tax=Glycomyces terrestris TaxID=2493553 RepID=A0A426UV78_9ACTN|nr:hypothetical protein [Glycomyces terrestris]RRR98237.1 hypothetical protein EIW28_15095 [Glycomyces terrestris]
MAIPTEASFVPPTTKAEEGALDQESAALKAAGARILGGGGDLLDRMSRTAVEFSELVADPIRREGAESIAASRAAMQGALHGSIVTSVFAGHVRTFKTEIAALVADWNAAVANDFGVTSGIPAEIAAAGWAKLRQTDSAAGAVYETFKGHAATAGAQLRTGPTPANIQALMTAAGGAVPTWLAYNAFGTQALDAGAGSALAQQLIGALRNGGSLPPGLLQPLMDLAVRARDLQRSGGTLAPGESGFLSGFYGAMGDPALGPVPSQQDHLFALPSLIKHTDLDATQQAAVLAAVGGGLLALSDQRLNPGLGPGATAGTGPQFLPPSLRELVDSHLSGGPRPVSADADLPALAEMIRAADAHGLADMQAGTALSAALTMELAGTGVHANDPGDADAMTLLNASTRNIDANAGILDGTIQHAAFGADTDEYVLRGLFGHRWTDGGATAGRLIDWIPAASTDPNTAGQAARAALGLIDTMTDETGPHAFGTSAYTFFTDGYGRVDVDLGNQQYLSFQDAPIGAANPEIARAMGRTAAMYLDVFAQEPVAGRGNGPTGFTGDAPGFYLDVDTRTKFFELVMGDARAAHELGSTVYAEIMADAAGLHDESLGTADASGLAARSGSLLGYLNVGFDRVHQDAQGDMTTEQQRDAHHASWTRSAAAITKEIVQEAPFVRGLSKAGQILVREGFELLKWGPGYAEVMKTWPYGDAVMTEQQSTPVDPMFHEFALETSHGIVEDMHRTGKLSLEDIAAHEEGLVVRDKATQAILRMRTAQELLGTFEQPAGGAVFGPGEAKTALERLFGSGTELDQKYRTYVEWFQLHRTDVQQG